MLQQQQNTDAAILINASPAGVSSALPFANTATTVATATPTPQLGLSVEQRMRIALNAVMNKGETPTSAARKWHLKRTILLHNILREKKRQRYLVNNIDGGSCLDSGSSQRKMFQSKFTSNQLLSAQQEENLANYLKQCYEMQWQHISPDNNNQPPITPSTRPPLLSEEVARSFTHNFVHMHKLRYPSSWDAKQQAATDWFNGFVDRNPEVIECVETSNRERKQRKRLSRTHAVVKLETNECGQRIETDVKTDDNPCSDLFSEDQYSAHEGEKNDSNWPLEMGLEISTRSNFDHRKELNRTPSTDLRIKVEPSDGADDAEDDDDDDDDVMEENRMKNHFPHFDSNTDTDPDIFIPKIVYQTADSPATNTRSKDSEDILPTESIAESVKRRTMRKPRILAEHLYAAEMTMEPERTAIIKHQRNQIFPVKKLTATANPIKIQKVQTFYQQPSQDVKKELQSSAAQESSQFRHQSTQSLDHLKESIEKMHSDMNYLLQSLLMEMGENNRLLRRLITANESK